MLRVPAQGHRKDIPRMHHPQHPLRTHPLHRLGKTPFQVSPLGYAILSLHTILEGFFNDMHSFFRRLLRYSLRYCVIVYRLIGAPLIGNYFGHPFLFKI